MNSCHQIWSSYLVRKNVDEDFKAIERFYSADKAFTVLQKKYNKEKDIAKKTEQLVRLGIVHTLRCCFPEAPPKACGNCSVCTQYATCYLTGMKLYEEVQYLSNHCQNLQTQLDDLTKKTTNLLLAQTNQSVNVTKPILKCQYCDFPRKNNKKNTLTCGTSMCENKRKAINTQNWRAKHKSTKNPKVLKSH